jgi:SAM-dependent methyltransferase
VPQVRLQLETAVKTRESGMPEEAQWTTFFNPEATLRALGLRPESGVVVDFGCGYGTFAIPAAHVVQARVYAFDIELSMVRATLARAEAEGLHNLVVQQRDLMVAGTGLPPKSVGYAMLFNVLHCEKPEVLLREVWRVLAPDGLLAITHWNFDPATPRGPSMSIRPRPEQCRAWAQEAGFASVHPHAIDLPPYHYGLLLQKHGGESGSLS